MITWLADALTLLWFHVRILCGWGSPAEVNRQIGWRIILGSSATMLFFPIALWTVVSIGPLLSGRPNDVFWFRFDPTFAPYLVLLLSLVWLPGIISLWLGYRGTGQMPVSVYGRCYAVLFSSFIGFFARIGVSEQTARWYALPLNWDETVTPGSDEFELLTHPVTSYVERLRRLGSAPRELRRNDEALVGRSADMNDGEADDSGTDGGEATPE